MGRNGWQRSGNSGWSTAGFECGRVEELRHRWLLFLNVGDDGVPQLEEITDSAYSSPQRSSWKRQALLNLVVFQIVFLLAVLIGIIIVIITGSFAQRRNWYPALSERRQMVTFVFAVILLLLILEVIWVPSTH